MNRTYGYKKNLSAPKLLANRAYHGILVAVTSVAYCAPAIKLQRPSHCPPAVVVVVSILSVLYSIYKSIHLKEQFCIHAVTNFSHGNNRHATPLQSEIAQSGANVVSVFEANKVVFWIRKCYLQQDGFRVKNIGAL